MSPVSMLVQVRDDRLLQPGWQKGVLSGWRHIVSVEQIGIANELSVCVWVRDNYSYVFALRKWLDICGNCWNGEHWRWMNWKIKRTILDMTNLGCLFRSRWNCWVNNWIKYFGEVWVADKSLGNKWRMTKADRGIEKWPQMMGERDQFKPWNWIIQALLHSLSLTQANKGLTIL